MLDDRARLIRRRLGQQILELGACELVLADVELRPRQLEARPGEARLGEHDPTECEDGCVGHAAVESGDAEQVVERRIAAEPGL